MLTTNAEAALIARELGAKAMTDVTGFGLAGHLGAMLRASGVSAVVNVAALPALPGAVALLAQGLRSTSHPENAKARKGFLVRPGAGLDPRFELLFDPQTSGGLLFGMKPERVEEALERLEHAAVIGEVQEVRSDGALLEVVSESSERKVAVPAPCARSPRMRR
jgi:selenide,water dikinase